MDEDYIGNGAFSGEVESMRWTGVDDYLDLPVIAHWFRPTPEPEDALLA